MYFYHCLSQSRISKDACPGVTIREDALLDMLADMLQDALDTALGQYTLSLAELSRQAADRAELREKITKLGDTPKMCEVYRLDPAYRRMVVDQYLVFYRVTDENKIVEIHRVLRGAWNLPQYLE